MTMSKERNELQNFKRWVFSLDRHCLLEAMAITFHPNTPSSPCISHEYDLFLEMTRNQSPPPVPVHCKAVGYTPCSQRGSRLDYFYREEERLRWTQPRMFKLEIDEEEFRRNLRGHHVATTSQQRKVVRYKVIARLNVTKSPWGDNYGVGNTREQRVADAAIILGTRLSRQRPGSASSRILLHSIFPDKNIACFVPFETPMYVPGSNDSLESLQDPNTILWMIRTASRGHFLQTVPSKKLRKCFFAPWLEPVHSWFSLSRYLASRYEVALWESYRRRLRESPKPNSPFRDMELWEKYDSKQLSNFVVQAIRNGLRETLKLEQQHAKLVSIRDGMIWSLLDFVIENMAKLMKPSFNQFDPSTFLRCSSQVPLVNVDCPFNNGFETLVLLNVESLLIEELDRNSEKEAATLVSVKIDPVVVFDRTGTGLGKKRKSKKGKKKRNGAVTSTKVLVPLPVIPASSESEEDDQDLEVLRKDLSKKKDPKLVIEISANKTPSRNRNRALFGVLGILDEILEDAFEQVGLSRSTAFKSDLNANGEESVSAAPTIEWKVSFPGKCKRRQHIDLELSDVSANGDRKNKPDGRESVARQQNPSVHLRIGPYDAKCQEKNPRSSHASTGVIGRPPSSILQSTDQYIYSGSHASWGVPVCAAVGALADHFYVSPGTFPPIENVKAQYHSQSRVFAAGFHEPFAWSLGLENPYYCTDEASQWPILNRHNRDQSIFTDFFDSRDSGCEEDEDDEGLMAASTAASISSSTYKDTTLIVDPEDLEGIVAEESDMSCALDENTESEAFEEECHAVESNEATSELHPTVISLELEANITMEEASEKDFPKLQNRTDADESSFDCRSPSPEAPLTPPPTLSPILLSLADLKHMQNETTQSSDPFKMAEMKRATARFLPAHGSLPNSPIPPPQNKLTSRWSRDDLRIDSFRDDQSIKQRRFEHAIRAEGTLSYKSVTVRSLGRPIAPTKGASVDFHMDMTGPSLVKPDVNRDSCARSETALDGERDDECVWIHEEADSPSVTRDEATTITSGASHKGEAEEITVIREERNNFRDMCLTLGAEVAKLKAILAVQQAAAAAPVDCHDGYTHPMVYRPGSSDPHGMQPFFHGMNSTRTGPMSDAGFHRGDQESQVSEDEVVSRARDAHVDAMRRMSSSQTIAGSDVSVDFNNSNAALSNGPLPGTMPIYDSVNSNGLQSRLTKDIFHFLNAKNLQLRKLNGKRKLAVERFTRLVKTIWPRAQVKLYGSYMSGLCLPSSDLDFVICLPAVHKKDPALAPGVLEGRNAINETSQKLLARELKGESWIDPRSINFIERTIVPVIKVSTKDTRAKMIQLDISFDSPEHHGLEANQMVAAILDELPMIRPLMLVMKQFLLDRGLLTAYTGGLSSYCLFLMLARYLQEQPPSIGDPGSLFLGALDFYGNHFDPRATGISVRRRQYFARSHNYHGIAYHRPNQAFWTNAAQPLSHQPGVVVNLPVPTPQRDFRRQNSFSETGSTDGNRQRQHHRFPPIPGSASSTGPNCTRVFIPRTIPPRHDRRNDEAQTSFDHVRPFTFDPLFVEDPLSASNNVGRNAFRINQVQRAFSDAHRALVASLDWDICPTDNPGGTDFPLLKCLLQGEDVLSES